MNSVAQRQGCVLVNSRTLQLSLRKNQEICTYYNDIYYLKDIQDLVLSIMEYCPRMVVLDMKRFDGSFISQIQQIRQNEHICLTPIILITDILLSPRLKDFFQVVLPSNYTALQLCDGIGTVTEYYRSINNGSVDNIDQRKDLLQADIEQEKNNLINKKNHNKQLLIDWIKKELVEINHSFSIFHEELFAGSDLGESVKRTVDQYLQEEDSIVISRLRTELKILFWKHYEAVLEEYCDTKELPLAKKYFLRFGIIDTRLLSEEMINWFKKFPYSNIHNVPIYYVDEWIYEIINGVYEISALDETIAKVPAQDYPNLPSDKSLKYEFQNIKQMSKVASAVQGTNFPFLDKSYVQDYRNCLINREKAYQYYKKVDEEVDPTIFEKTTLTGIEHKAARILIVPSYGAAAVTWQVWDKSDRDDSGGRIICPFVSTIVASDKTLIRGFGSYRWDFAQMIDPLRYMLEGLIGDYQLLNKKNRGDLSGDFIENYYLWITKEANNRAVFTKEMRRYFWVKCPFGRTAIENVSKNMGFRDILKIGKDSSTQI